MKITERLTSSYAKLVIKAPWIFILLVIILSGFLFIQSQNVETVSSDNSDALPDNIDVIVAFNKITDKFGSSDSAMIVLQLDPEQKFAVSDIRSRSVFEAMSLLGDLALDLDDIDSVTSAVTLIKSSNAGILPSSDMEIRSFVNSNPFMGQYLSDNYDLAIISLSLSDNYDELDLLSELNSVITQVHLPPGLIVDLGGDVLAGAIVSQTIGEDMGKTSMYSLLGILIVLFFIFRSLKYTFMPLVTIGVGILWTMGYIGLMGMNLSSVTSGVISMIMGIGIDFGIQIVSRFRQEMKTTSLLVSMTTTLNAVFMPMTTTTLAAVIGFKAMSLGDLTFLAEMGQMMSYGVIGCYFAAMLILPSLLVLFETTFANKNKKLKLTKHKKVK